MIHSASLFFFKYFLFKILHKAAHNDSVTKIFLSKFTQRKHMIDQFFQYIVNKLDMLANLSFLYILLICTYLFERCVWPFDIFNRFRYTQSICLLCICPPNPPLHPPNPPPPCPLFSLSNTLSAAAQPCNQLIVHEGPRTKAGKFRLTRQQGPEPIIGPVGLSWSLMACDRLFLTDSVTNFSILDGDFWTICSCHTAQSHDPIDHSAFYAILSTRKFPDEHGKLYKYFIFPKSH